MQVAVEPRFLQAYQQLCGGGSSSQLTSVDARELAGEQEEVPSVELQQRALRERQVSAGGGLLGSGPRELGASLACKRGCAAKLVP